MCAAGVSRLVYVSSLSALRPPRTPWERQDERTPIAPPDAREFGSYAWGKTEAERAVAAEAASLGIETRVIRPAALVDWTNPEMPGLVGRRLTSPGISGLVQSTSAARREIGRGHGCTPVTLQ